MPKPEPLTVVVVEFSYGESEAWGFDSGPRAKSFLEALDYLPGVSNVVWNDARDGFSFSYESSDGHTAEIDPNARYVLEELPSDRGHGELDHTAFPMHGIPVRLVNPPPRHITPKRQRLAAS